MKKTIYYTNELTDEFSDAKINAKLIDGDYSYEGGPFRMLGRFFAYHIFAKCLGFLYLKIKFGHRIKNKKALRLVKGRSYFLYGNHTNQLADPFVPSMINFTGSVYVIVHPDNVSMPVLGKITPVLGALPLPDTKDAMKNFNAAMRHILERRRCIMIYPEAHIWPYYTKIRPFTQQSFGYPLTYGCPVMCFTNTYQKRRFFKTPRLVTYVDGPFYADPDLPRGTQKQMLRDQVYNAMVERSKNSNVEMIQYIKKEN